MRRRPESLSRSQSTWLLRSKPDLKRQLLSIKLSDSNKKPTVCFKDSKFKPTSRMRNLTSRSFKKSQRTIALRALVLPLPTQEPRLKPN